MTVATKSEDTENGRTQNSAKKVKGKFGTRHFQAFLLFLGMVSAFNTRSSMSVALVAMTDEVPPNPDFPSYKWKNEFGLISSGFVIGLAILQIPFGYLATVKSAQKLHSITMFISGIMHALVPIMAKYGDWPAVLAVRILMGVCQASLMSCTQALLSKWSPPFERSRLAMFIFNGTLMGNVIAMPISGALAKSIFGWPSIFYVFGFLTSVWGLGFFFFGKDSPAEHPSISTEERDYIENSIGKNDDKSRKIKVPWRAMFTSLPVWCLIIASGGHNWGFYMLLTQLPNYLKNILGYDIQDSGIVSALPYLCAWVVAFPFSWITDYFLKKGCSVTVVRKVANSVSIWGPAVAMVLLCVVDRDKVITVMIMTVAVSLNCGVFCGFQVSHIDVSPNFAGTMMSITNFVGNIMGLLAPNIFSLVVTDMKNPDQWNVIFLVTAFLYFFSNAIFIIFGSSKKQPWNEIGFTRSESSKTIVSDSSELNVY